MRLSREVLLLLVLCVAGGIYQNHQRIAHWLNPPPPGSTNVVLYATTWCGYCAQARSFFTRNGIAYREVDVEKSEEGQRDYQRLGGGGVPIIVIDNATVIHGFNADSVLAALQR
jgi:mycoredoxin